MTALVGVVSPDARVRLDVFGTVAEPGFITLLVVEIPVASAEVGVLVWLAVPLAFPPELDEETFPTNQDGVHPLSPETSLMT